MSEDSIYSCECSLEECSLLVPVAAWNALNQWRNTNAPELYLVQADHVGNDKVRHEYQDWCLVLDAGESSNDHAAK